MAFRCGSLTSRVGMIAMAAHLSLAPCSSSSSFHRPRPLQPLTLPTSVSFSGLRRRLAMASIAGATPPQTSNEKEEIEFWERLRTHQKEAAKLSAVEEARTVLDRSLNAYLSSISQRYDGYPYGSYVDIAAEEDGSVVIAVSSLAPHAKDLERTSNCSLLVMKDKLDRSDVIVTYIGEAMVVPELEEKRVRDSYLLKHPEAFWVDFGDFKFLRIKPVHIRYMTGIVTPFNAIGEFSGDEFINAKIDPIAQFSAPIASHMNRDHAEATRMMVEAAIGIKVDHGKIIDLDRMGLNVQVGYNGNLIKLRVPFPRPANDRKDVKILLTEMVDSSKHSSNTSSK